MRLVGTLLIAIASHAAFASGPVSIMGTCAGIVESPVIEWHITEQDREWLKEAVEKGRASSLHMILNDIVLDSIGRQFHQTSTREEARLKVPAPQVVYENSLLSGSNALKKLIGELEQTEKLLNGRFLSPPQGRFMLREIKKKSHYEILIETQMNGSSLWYMIDLQLHYFRSWDQGKILGDLSKISAIDQTPLLHEIRAAWRRLDSRNITTLIGDL